MLSMILNHRRVVLAEKEDVQGFLNVNIGEMLNGKYKITSISGRGVFGTVAKAIDVDNLKSVAIKIIRRGEAYERSGEREINMLSLLSSCDPNGIFCE